MLLLIDWNSSSDKEFLKIAENIDEAIGDAYGAIVDAAQAFERACEKSKNFQDIKVLENIGMDRAFDNLENGSSYRAPIAGYLNPFWSALFPFAIATPAFASG